MVRTMPEAPTGETQAQSGPTAARQMLAALTRHSQEITKRFGESCEYVSRLNSTLENKVNSRLADINETAEHIVRSQLENLSAEKDSVLAELTELRQEELKVLQSIGKDLREALSSRLQELLAELKSEIDSKLETYQESVVQTESEVSATLVSLRKGLSEKTPLHISAIQEEGNAARKDLEDTQAKQKELLNQEASLSIDSLALHCDELKGKLEKSGEDYFKSLDELLEKLLSSQREKLQQRMQSISEMQASANKFLVAEIDEASLLLSAFSASSQQIVDLRLGLHNSMVNNLALIYRTELLSAAQETEDQLIIVRSHLHSVVRGYHDYYSEQSNILLTKFENSAREALPEKHDSQSGLETEELPAEVQQLFARFKEELNNKIKELIASADSRLEESLGEFRNQLNQASQKFSNMAESSFNDYRKEIADAAEANKATLEDLSQKTDALQQLVEESKELISALDQSNLEF